MKKLVSILLVLILLALSSKRSFAGDNAAFPESSANQCAGFSYITRTIEELPVLYPAPYFLYEIRVKTGTATYSSTSGNGTVLWTASLTGTFHYDGYSATCVAASCSESFPDSHYSLANKTVSMSGNSAIASITIAYKILGITIYTETHTLTLSCDGFGNLS